MEQAVMLYGTFLLIVLVFVGIGCAAIFIFELRRLLAEKRALKERIREREERQ